MTAADLARLEALADAATPGPWRADVAWTDRADCWRVFFEGDPINHRTNTRDCPLRQRDAAFIAAARTAVPALCEALRAERARTERLVGLLREVYGAPQFDDSPLPQDLCDRIDAEFAKGGE